MSSKPITTTVYCSKALSPLRYWETFKCPMSGWLLVTNLSTSDIVRLHWESAGDENSDYEPIKPLHVKPFQVDEGDQVWLSSGILNTRIRLEIAKYKPVKEEYGYDDDAATVNLSYSSSDVAVTTTYDTRLTGTTPAYILAKGYGSYFQVSADAGGFAGTIEWSNNGGANWSSPIVMNSADPLKKVFEENVVFNVLRITVTAGTFTVYYR